jgi:hypothetical protein
VKGDSASRIINVSGKLVLNQRERISSEEMLYSAFAVLVGSCEQVLHTAQDTQWTPCPCLGVAARHPQPLGPSKPHLTLALWLYGGAAGIRVWLPLPRPPCREEKSSRSFMAGRIMLHFPLNNIYLLAMLFKGAIILGAENDTQLYMGGNREGPSSLPFCTLERVSEVYLQQLLR